MSHNQADTTAIPAHIGLILDGNRRWAKAQGLPAVQGHREGMETLKSISHRAFDKGVKYLSAFVFSSENWQRAEEEVNYLMSLLIKAVEKYLDEYHERGIKIVIVGRREGLRKSVLDAITRAEVKTAGNSNGTLALCFNYGGIDEITDAVKQIVSRGVPEDEITNDVIAKSMYTPELPSIDFLIRTSGEQRLSGFMLYRAAYAELYFTDTYWPAFKTVDFDNALDTYSARERRFGT